MGGLIVEHRINTKEDNKKRARPGRRRDHDRYTKAHLMEEVSRYSKRLFILIKER